MGDVNHEPTMEEILASIKKIIAEDGDAPVSAPDARQHRTRPEPEPETPEEAPHAEAEHEEEDVLELTDQLAAAEQEAAETPAEPIVSEETVEASKAALAALSAIAARPAAESGEAADTHPLEGLVREMLRPMLKDWLDENLPSMVEELVAREIARIAAGGK